MTDSNPIPASLFIEFYELWKTRTFLLTRQEIEAIVDLRGKQELSKHFDFKMVYTNFEDYLGSTIAHRSIPEANVDISTYAEDYGDTSPVWFYTVPCEREE
uniref:Phage protein n=1 Tax=Steinernema glaseri TaxID=37863 RepID=A0A1I7YGE7_9BILA